LRYQTNGGRWLGAPSGRELRASCNEIVN
jgi:hypothetical protein